MLPSLFISHGSPMLALEPGASGPALARMAAQLPRPRAIVVMSAHWETTELRVTSNPHPPTWHDFGGFPAALYAVQYPVPGDPQLAEQVRQRLNEAGLPTTLDAKRPFDHGAWVPLSLMYPAADIPVVQVSLPSQHGPAYQQQVGQALAALREEGVLLIGSGSITHNLRELDWHAGPESVEPWALAFRDWMIDKLAAGDTPALHDYRRQAPFAVRNHPSDEHLLPLYFARGAGERFAIEHQGFTLGALGMDIYRFD
ncbi:dioxygenase [Pseudomonas sp. 1239]|uniref:DODA-type extradiol aromatic ring-opening family dioxygenase n=1 Tax=unclassified Pseudomonas TaxID=196821 RepID=UPI000B4E84C3|nr:class III extradiol ring-cleavage dioxygenase [Pseudomonas sp. 1239]OUM34048.1 dioxygenase [Pseudomonas sp. 1239]